MTMFSLSTVLGLQAVRTTLCTLFSVILMPGKHPGPTTFPPITSPRTSDHSGPILLQYAYRFAFNGDRFLKGCCTTNSLSIPDVTETHYCGRHGHCQYSLLSFS